MILLRGIIIILVITLSFVKGVTQDYVSTHKCFYLNESYKNYSVDSILNFVKPVFTEIDSFKHGLKTKNILHNYLGNLQKSTSFFYNDKGLLIKEIENLPQLNIKDSVKYHYNNSGKLLTRTVYSSDDGVIPYIGFLEKYQYIGDTIIETSQLKMFKEDSARTVVLKYLIKDGKSVPLWLDKSEEKEELQTIEKDRNDNIILIKNQLGLTIKVNKYDEKNRLILRLQYHKNGYLNQIDTYSYK